MEGKRTARIMDVSLLLFMVVVIGTILFIAGNQDSLFINTIYLMITFILVIVTYFTTIILGLVLTLLFLFGQTIYMLYQYFYLDQFSYLNLVWLVLPPLYCLAIYYITSLTRKLEENNRQLKNEAALGVLDKQTNLRTLNLFEDDFNAIHHLPQEYEVPLSLMVIRVRHWDSLKKLISTEQTEELLDVVTEELTQYFKENNFKYLIDRETPTWGILRFEKVSEMKVFRGALKERFSEKIRKSPSLKALNTDLVIGISGYVEAEMLSSTDFLADGIRELQYDV